MIVRLSSLGDIVHALPAQQRIAGAFPGAEVHWLSEPAYEPLLARVPGIARVWPADTRAWRRGLSFLREPAGLIRAFRKERFDIALDFQGLVKSAVLGRLSGAREVIGFSRDDLREPAAGRFYTRVAPRQKGLQRHVIEQNLSLLSWLGPEITSCNGASPLIPLEIPPEAENYVGTKLREHGIRNPVLINPGAGWVTKLWPARDYGRLFQRIKKELKLPVVFTYGPGEEGLIEQARQSASPAPLITFPTSILEFAALCRRSRLLVAGDTGPLHLAVAMGTPTVAIMGPTSPWRNGPFSSSDLVVKRYLPCSDSYKRTCDQFICMDIPVEEVFEALVRRLKL
ncbi:MAG: glycosyltransferase family 9 protein [Acidobacteriota bacterium]